MRNPKLALILVKITRASEIRWKYSEIQLKYGFLQTIYCAPLLVRTCAYS